MRGGRFTYRFVSRRQLLILLPIVGLVIGGLAIAFSQITGKSIDQVLFDGQDQLPGLINQSSSWSLAALTWLLIFKGVAYGLSLGSFRVRSGGRPRRVRARSRCMHARSFRVAEWPLIL